MLLTKSHPILASFVSAAVALLPLWALAVLAMITQPSVDAPLNQINDGSLRGVGVIIVISPFLYLAAVPVCYLVGSLLISRGVPSFGRFMVGASLVSLLLAIAIGAGLGWQQFVLWDLVLFSACTTLFSALPAALCWWFLAVRHRAIP